AGGTAGVSSPPKVTQLARQLRVAPEQEIDSEDVHRLILAALMRTGRAPDDQAHLPAHAGESVMPRTTVFRGAGQVQRLARRAVLPRAHRPPRYRLLTPSRGKLRMNPRAVPPNAVNT